MNKPKSKKARNLSASAWGLKNGLDNRRVRALCQAGRIVGAEKIGNSWVIPSTSKNPSNKVGRPKILKAIVNG